MPIRWIVHLKDGRTLVDGKCELDQIDQSEISSVESISPSGKKVIICSNPFFKNFFTLVTASDYVPVFGGKSFHVEEERIVGFEVGDTVIEVIIDCRTEDVKIRGRKK